MKTSENHTQKQAFPFGITKAVLVGLIALISVSQASGAGLLKPKTGHDNDINMKSHHVNVTINNGFARTEVDQIFVNTGDVDLDAIYTFPVPKKASLSELSLWIDGKEVLGEVVEKGKARKLHEEQKQKGNDTALAEKDDYKTFNVSVYPVRAHVDTRVRLVYYQPLEVDLNVGRYVYPLAEGGVDDERIAFWSVDDEVTESFKFKLTLKSAFPVKDVRLPHYDSQASVKKIAAADGEETQGDVYEATIENNEGQAARLAEDIVFYYRLDDTVPARVELIPYKEDATTPGTFMVVVTPGASLRRIAEGTDWTFVLDISGSMSGAKIATLADGVSKVLGKMTPEDRFRIITFNNIAHDITRGYVNASQENVDKYISTVKNIRANGGTALFAGLKEAYDDLDDERTTGIILVTDGVCNIGPTAHADFLELLRKYDIRLFTFVIGNSANQPLMERLAKDSGGFAMNISDRDDIVGRLIQAKAKVLHENLHDVKLDFSGAKVKNLTPPGVGNLYLGQQLIIFGQYDAPGEVNLKLTAGISGEDKAWTCKATLPEKDADNPELERLWALSAIDDTMEIIREKGENKDLRAKVVDIGTEYSIVTDYTSMIVLREEEMESLGIKRNNARRVHRERQAQQIRANQPVRNYSTRKNSSGGMFNGARAPSIGSSPVGPVIIGLLALTKAIKRRRGGA